MKNLRDITLPVSRSSWESAKNNISNYFSGKAKVPTHVLFWETGASNFQISSYMSCMTFVAENSAGII